MKRAAWLLGLAGLAGVLAGPPAARADDPRTSFRQGRKDYERKEYKAAADAFDRAARDASGARLDRAAALYNRANALFQAQEYDQALQQFQDALSTTDLELQERAYFNKGNTLMRLSARQEQTQQLDPAVKSVTRALEAYEQAMKLAPRDTDAKVNYEMALKKKEELAKKQEQQKQQQQQQNQPKDQSKPEEQKKDRGRDQPQNQPKPQPQPQDKASQPEKGEQQQQQAGKEPPQQSVQQQAGTSEAMTPEEAQMVLDAMKQEEQSRRDQLRVIMGQPVPVDKNW